MYEAFDNREVDMISTIAVFRNGREDGLHSVKITDRNSATLFVTNDLPDKVRCELADALSPIVEYLTRILNLISVETSQSGCQ